MGRYAQVMRRMGRTSWFAAVGSRLAPPIDRALHRLTGGRLHIAESFLPTCILTTVGRRSGQRRDQPLAYVREADTIYVVGTNWGGETHPGWTYNLMTHPDAEVAAKGDAWPVRGRLLDDDEFAAVWPRFVAMWPAYETYLERTDRSPRMFALDPR